MARAVFSIPAGAPFLDLLARGLLARIGDDAIALADAVVLLPTRRAARGLREAFLRVGDGRPMLLPRMLAIGDADDDELLADAAADGDGGAAADAVPQVERLLVLAETLRNRDELAGDPALAVKLAQSLAQLFDSAALDDVDLDRLEAVAERELAAHWQRSLDLLARARDDWRRHLAARALVDPAARRVAMLRARAQRWHAEPPRGWVVAAGSTGSIRATAELLACVASLPQGAVVLPGLDRGLDDESWAAILEDAVHPQHSLARLLEHLEVARAAVPDWVDDIAPSPRIALMREALRPAATTASWRVAARVEDASLHDLSVVEAPSPRAEAGAIALVMRQAIETPARTAALVTPDRALARRVASELARWGLTVDDSAGTPLARTPPGVLLRLMATMALEPSAPVELLSALKHPLVSGGRNRGELRARLRRLERRILRGLRPAPGFAGLLAALRACGESALATWFADIAERLAPLVDGVASSAIAPRELLTRHVAVAEWLTSDAEGGIALWSGEAGEAMREAMLELDPALSRLEPIAGRFWPRLFETLLDGRVVRPRLPSHPRLAIWGPLEARLQSADVVVLGGLNEGDWPPEDGEDPWLSRGMRATLGLSPLERRIGLSAHDFVQAACAPRVVVTRSRKVDGVPTTRSRWLQRLDAFLARDERWTALQAAPALDWATQLDVAAALAPIARPAPRPPVAARPREISVTRVETWLRDPYAIFAREILGLEPLDPLDLEPGAPERGTAVHVALADFLRAGDVDDAAASERLAAHGRAAFGALLERPLVQAMWWPRYMRLAEWFLRWERQRRAAGVRPLAVEVSGRLELDVPGGFTLRARADRIDRLPDGRLAIIDYKTGGVPSPPMISVGFAPQLPLEAAIAQAGGFTGIPGDEIGELILLRLGGGMPPGEEIAVEPKRDKKPVAVDTFARLMRAEIERLARQFLREETPYLSRPRPQFMTTPGDYDHLARVGEWSAAEDGA